MIRRPVIRAPARGYVDGRYIGEEKEPKDANDTGSVLGKRRGKTGEGRKGKRGAAVADGNTARPPRRGRAGAPAGPPRAGAATARRARGAAPVGTPAPRSKKRGVPRAPVEAGNVAFDPQLGNGPAPRGGTRKARGAKKTPFRAPQKALISEVAESRRLGEEVKSGQFAEALAASQNVKRERLHKVLAQSGHGSRRDMEILISSGRLMVNGIVAGAGTQVAPGDTVLLDHRPIKLKFTEELPRILLYHKPEGEIVTTNDPGNRITVFDNLPKVENGKWTAIGRLDINTSGLLIFTTSGELANRFMHPRYEVEREYAVRVLGTLSEEQQQRLLTGVSIADEDDDEPAEPARFDSIEKRGGEGVNQWYQVTIKEGRNREVRKMFEAVGLTVSRLIRTRFGIITLPPRLMRGKLLELGAPQVLGVMSAIGLNSDGTGAPPPARRVPRGDKRVARHADIEVGNRFTPPLEIDPDENEMQPHFDAPHETQIFADEDAGNRIADERADEMLGNLLPDDANLIPRSESDRRHSRRNRRGMLGRGERRAGRDRRERLPTDGEAPAFIPISDEAFRIFRAEQKAQRAAVPREHKHDPQRDPPRDAQREPRPPRQEGRPPRTPAGAVVAREPTLGKGRRTFRRRRREGGGGGGGGSGEGGQMPPSADGNR